MDSPPHLPSNSAEILGRQQRAVELRATGLTVREVAQQLNCSLYAAQTLLNRADDRRVDAADTGWLAGLPHRAARTLLELGYKTKADVANALAIGRLTSDQPGVSQKTLTVLTEWLASEIQAEAAQMSSGLSAEAASGTQSRETG